ncbi:uncharacterized protein LOC112568971 isoform X2 [Pomacea canaliculata]|uniref:uncharacterized protein LOC112568971 isoform X2 n=1 Tax=Pomacea canaliculata TaxID=400727 RepID=UPI000D72793A|nr:uncharacterized protein LOC112568971 isoform X2 [Pomacea canaliculata]
MRDVLCSDDLQQTLAVEMLVTCMAAHRCHGSWLTLLVVIYGTYKTLGTKIINCNNNKVEIFEDSPAPVTCGDISSTGDVEWRRGDGVSIGECKADGSCFTALYNDYRLSRSAQSTESQLTLVPDYRRHAGVTVTCHDRMGASTASCTLVIKRHSELSECHVTTNPVDWTVSGSCRVQQAFSSDNIYTCTWTRNTGQTFGGFDASRELCSFTQALPQAGGLYTYSISVSPPATTAFSQQLTLVEPGDVTTTCPQLVISGQNLSCTCQTTNTASPPATVRWEGRDSEKLVKTNVQREDNGTQFTCHVTWAGRVYTSITYTLIVAVEPGSVTTTCPQLLISGQNLSCTCQTTNTASPPATVRWEGRDSEKLVKTNVQREDNGTQFTCHVTWTGRVYTSINYTLLVHVEPGNITTSCPDLVISGQDLSCTCQTTNTASPPATVRWEGRDSEKLVKTNVQREDNGTQFTCHVTWAGRVYTSINYSLLVISVEGPSDVVISLTDAGSNGSSVITLSCNTTGVVYPSVNFTWSTGVCHNETHAARSSTCTASLHAEDDGKSVTCTAINSNDSRISVSTSVTLRIDGAGNIFILTSDSHSTTSAVLGPVVGAAVAVVVAAVIAILFVVLIKKRRRKIKKAPEKTIRSPPCQDSEFEDHINVVYESSDTAGPKSSSTTSHWNKQVCTRKYEDIPSEGYYSQIRQMATGKTFAESDRCLTMNLYSN